MYTTLHNVHKSTSYFCSTAARRPWRRLQDVVPNVLHAIRHAPISCPVLHSAARRCILHSFYCYSEMNPSNYHSTCAQMTPKHKNDRHTDLNIDSPFPPLSCSRTALCCYLPTPTPTTKMCSNSKSDCHISSCRSRKKKKKEEEKQWKLWFFSLLVGNLSYTINFNIPPHKLLYLKPLWKKKGLQTGENVAAGVCSNAEYQWRGARTLLSPALSSTWPLMLILFPHFANLFVPPRSIPHTKRLWHVAHSHAKRECKDMQTYACGDLVCKDHKESNRRTKGEHDSSDGCHRMSHFL